MIESALSSLGVPVKHPPYRGTEKTYITYQLILNQSALNAEGGEQEAQTFLALDLFTNQPWEALAAEIKTRLIASGYHGIVYGPEIFEDDTKLWHIPFSFWRLGDGEV